MRCPTCQHWNTPADTWEDGSVAYMCDDCCTRYVMHAPENRYTDPKLSVDTNDVVEFLVTCESSPDRHQQLLVPGARNAIGALTDMFRNCLLDPLCYNKPHDNMCFELSISANPDVVGDIDPVAELESMCGEGMGKLACLSINVSSLNLSALALSGDFESARRLENEDGIQ